MIANRPSGDEPKPFFNGVARPRFVDIATAGILSAGLPAPFGMLPARAKTASVQPDERRLKQIVDVAHARSVTVNDGKNADLPLNPDVDMAESPTNQHNPAIAYLLQSTKFMYSDSMEACDIHYTRECSVAVTPPWQYDLGLPVKSGVGGGIVAVSPSDSRIAAFSPPLDEAGNSVRAQLAIARIANQPKANIYAD